MLIVVENGKLIQNQNPSYFSSLSSDRYEQLKLDQIFAPLEFYLKDNNGRTLTKNISGRFLMDGNYRGAGGLAERDGKQFVILGSGNFSYLEEYEIGDVTKESDDFYTGVLWGVYKAFLAYKKKKSKVFSYANWVPKPRQELPRSSAALEGVKYGEAEFKRLFGRQKKMKENPDHAQEKSTELTKQKQNELRILAAGLQKIGWEIREIDIDLVSDRVVVRAFRNDGRWVYLHVSPGKAVMERFQRTTTGTRVKKGPSFDAHSDEFLGRERYPGGRVALRYLCAYLADNPAPNRAAISVQQVRALFAPLLT